MRVALGLQLLSTVFPEPPWRLRSIAATKEIDYQKQKNAPSAHNGVDYKISVYWCASVSLRPPRLVGVLKSGEIA